MIECSGGVKTFYERTTLTTELLCRNVCICTFHKSGEFTPTDNSYSFVKNHSYLLMDTYLDNVSWPTYSLVSFTDVSLFDKCKVVFSIHSILH